MVNGRLYDAETMNEVGNRKKARQPFYWELSKTAGVFDWHESSETSGYERCSCGKH
jgi:hypothetical protein